MSSVNALYDQNFGVRSAMLAAVSYCDTETAMALSCQGCKAINSFYKTLTMTEKEAGWGVHAYAFIVSDTEKVLAVSFRGTDQPAELIRELTDSGSQDYPFPGNNLPQNMKLLNYFATVYSVLRDALLADF